MASSRIGLTKTRSLGKYNASRGKAEGKPQQEERRVTPGDVEVTRECAGCGKHIKKGKVFLACACNQVVHCGKECARSSNHVCHQPASLANHDHHNKLIHQNASVAIYSCYTRCKADLEAGRAPSSQKIEKMMRRTKGDPENLLALAEAGDALAAFVLGSGSQGEGIPRKNKSILETKWLNVAAEGGVPEGMFLLAMKLLDCGCDSGTVVDHRIGNFWLVEAYKTGEMDYLIEPLEIGGMGLAKEFENLHSFADGRDNHFLTIMCPTLSNLLMATRWKELIEWGGKTAMGEPFYGRRHFNAFLEEVGGLKKFEESQPISCVAKSQRKEMAFIFISGRPGSVDLTSKFITKERNENNTKFLQGVKAETNPDFQLIVANELDYGMTLPTSSITPIANRTGYLVACKHDESDVGKAKKVEGPPGSMGMLQEGGFDLSKYKPAGGCHPCYREAFQRLRAVSLGQYSISLTEIIPDYSYAARYVTVDGVIVQDVFKVYSKPDIRQVLQCLMSNPADLHPLAVAEDQNLYWPIVWFWGSVFSAVQDTCDGATLRAIYGGLEEKRIFGGGWNGSAMAAFPESAAGEWRIACGSELCPKVDHQVKFNLCKGCKIRRYCDEDCQRRDWPKHRGFCKAGNKVGS